MSHCVSVYTEGYVLNAETNMVLLSYSSLEGLKQFFGMVPPPSQEELPLEKNYPSNIFFQFFYLDERRKVDFSPTTQVPLEASRSVAA